jgi:hypothetical protein
MRCEKFFFAILFLDWKKEKNEILGNETQNNITRRFFV